MSEQNIKGNSQRAKAARKKSQQQGQRIVDKLAKTVNQMEAESTGLAESLGPADGIKAMDVVKSTDPFGKDGTGDDGDETVPVDQKTQVPVPDPTEKSTMDAFSWARDPFELANQSGRYDIEGMNQSLAQLLPNMNQAYFPVSLMPGMKTLGDPETGSNPTGFLLTTKTRMATAKRIPRRIPPPANNYILDPVTGLPFAVERKIMMKS